MHVNACVTPARTTRSTTASSNTPVVRPGSIRSTVTAGAFGSPSASNATGPTGVATRVAGSADSTDARPPSERAIGVEHDVGGRGAVDGGRLDLDAWERGGERPHEAPPLGRQRLRHQPGDAHEDAASGGAGLPGEQRRRGEAVRHQQVDVRGRAPGAGRRSRASRRCRACRRGRRRPGGPRRRPPPAGRGRPPAGPSGAWRRPSAPPTGRPRRTAGRAARRTRGPRRRGRRPAARRDPAPAPPAPPPGGRRADTTRAKWRRPVGYSASSWVMKGADAAGETTGQSRAVAHRQRSRRARRVDRPEDRHDPLRPRVGLRVGGALGLVEEPGARHRVVADLEGDGVAPARKRRARNSYSIAWATCWAESRMPPCSGRSTTTSRPSGGPTTGPQSRSATPPDAVAVDGRPSRRAPTLTQTPSGPAATPRGCEPTRTGASTRCARASIRATTPRSGFAATTCAPDTVTSVTPAPTS